MNIESLYEIYLRHSAIQTDSRKVKAGDFFFALRGDNFDGNAFAEKAIEQGAAYAVIDNIAYQKSEQYILVSDTLQALQQLAAHHRQQLQVPVIGITGSNGKTTTKELVTAVLQSTYKTYATIGNLNNHIGVPLTLLGIKPDAEMVIIEMGANHIGEIASYCTIVRPNYGLINNIGKAHLEGFGSLEGVKKAKGELYDHLRANQGVVFINNDLEYLTALAKGIDKQVTYGTANAQLIGKALHHSEKLSVAILSAMLEVVIHTQLVGDYNLPNVLAAVAIGNYFKIPIETIKEALEAYIPSNSRSQWIEKGLNKIILDAYNANPTSMKLALENLANLDAPNKVVLLGAMKEMGTELQKEHQTLVDLAMALNLSQVYLVGAEYNQVNHSFQQFDTSEALKQHLIAHPISNATVLIKGSRGSKMEVTLDAF